MTDEMLARWVREIHRDVNHMRRELSELREDVTEINASELVLEKVEAKRIRARARIFEVMASLSATGLLFTSIAALVH
jgi:hypothetical protein